MRIKYYKSKGEWFDKDSPARLIDDYRPNMNAGLFIGYHKDELDEEACSFDEFEEIEMEENGYLNVDRAWHFQNDYWRNIKNKEQKKKEEENRNA